ncbi:MULTISPECIES: sensor domain-containing diguanylate cyclase [unclassified Paenibacillus]|uniref:sensor domain-containing diguanylate cyclase n=1 Tax=unclassified Paenibacillus TaxID=185978 RepID=UPI002404A6E6|nr:MULTISPECIES: sensor domain-containing diguanylate cyclase [unclassified Paenibacillus]MDF9839503.1 diguanylate cyclase [Paenibacillus sp. PastF-2]MDF9846084.1 diguanylate cyclase [Paenibacillus sp. PastM-2]MDF9852657.1 diguanylate cyclase [Paenibacillus sp. PastF-1]MDH6477612.1 diguanylate cyclase [Paenibacillus sp. PastH-2]MDH6505355.1 diguanylate cyclase [Paenibacillus sp. PastM-3]
MIIQEIASAEPFIAASRNIIDVLKKSVDVTSLFVAVNENRINRVIKSYSNGEELVPEGTNAPFEETYCRIVCAGGRVATVIPSTAADPLTATLQVTRKLGDCSFIGVPLIFGESTPFGTICALDRRIRRFTQSDIDMFNAMAALLSNVMRSQYEQYVDPITEGYNRRILEKFQESADLKLRPLSVVVMDINGFKTVNRLYGQAFGDSLLARCARIQRQVFGEGSLTIRLQADYFVNLSRERSPSRMLEQSQALLAALEKVSLPDGSPLLASAGLAFSELWTEGLTGLLHQADSKMLTVKNRSRHGFAY